MSRIRRLTRLAGVILLTFLTVVFFDPGIATAATLGGKWSGCASACDSQTQSTLSEALTYSGGVVTVVFSTSNNPNPSGYNTSPGTVELSGIHCSDSTFGTPSNAVAFSNASTFTATMSVNFSTECSGHGGVEGGTTITVSADIPAYASFYASIWNAVYTLPASIPAPPPPVSGCSAIYSVNASYVGTTLSVQVLDNSTSTNFGIIPGNNVSVHAGDTPPTLQLNKATTAVAGNSGDYYAQYTVSSGITLPENLTVVSEDATGAITSSSCITSTSISQNQITSSGSPADSDTNTSDSCGFSLNPYSWVKCLFYPQHGFTQWTQFETNVTTKPPGSLVTTGLPYFSNVAGTSSSNVSCATTGGPYNNCADLELNNESNGNRTSIFASLYPFMQSGSGQSLYIAEEVLIWGGGLIALWNRATSSFGEKSG